MRFTVPLLAALMLGSATAQAEQPADFEASFAAEAQRADPGFTGFSPTRGAQFFRSTHGNDWSCASCHGDLPVTAGKHAITGRSIDPLAPNVNPNSFRRAASVEKWFRRNCNDVLKRPCSAQEKGDVLAWLVTLDAKGTR